MIVSCALATEARAQSSSPNVVGAQWIDLGATISSAGLGLLFDYARLAERRLWRGRVIAQTNLGGGVNPAPSRSVTEVSVLAGRGRVCCGGNWGSASLGLGVVVITEDGAQDSSSTTVGLAAEADLISWRNPHLSVRVFGNANIERPFAGAALAIAVGRMPWVR